jgi:hypothetical protein
MADFNTQNKFKGNAGNSLKLMKAGEGLTERSVLEVNMELLGKQEIKKILVSQMFKYVTLIENETSFSDVLRSGITMRNGMKLERVFV